MVAHIALYNIIWRELYDNLNSLRFAVATVLLLGLMFTNAVVHLREHPERIRQYQENVSTYQNEIHSHAENSLYDLAQKGPGLLYKKLSDLRFCSDGSEIFLPEYADGGYNRWSTDTLKSFWILTYPIETPNQHNVRVVTTKVDWYFIIGYVLSLIALLFTFDSISGERERGTLRLTLANSIPRYSVLIGKFLGALISITIPFTLSILMNLLIVSTASDIHLRPEIWERLGIIFLIAIIYTCLFLGLGLLVSAMVQRSAVSLVILLLVWVVFVVFMPITLASIAGKYTSSGPTYDLWEVSSKIYKEQRSDYYSRMHNEIEGSIKRIDMDGEFVIKDAEKQERLHTEQLSGWIAEVKQARNITRFSPVTIFQHLLESFAGTGFERHLQFIENVQSYTREFREFIMDTDRTDPDSLHILGIREGMSKKTVIPESVPLFEDTINLSQDFNRSVMDILLLTMFVVVLLSGAYLAFVRLEV